MIEITTKFIDKVSYAQSKLENISSLKIRTS